MNYSKFLICLILLSSISANAQYDKERKQSTASPLNNYHTPSSYVDFDHYAKAKEEGYLVYGVNYIFEGISASDVSQQLIDEIDPYRYLNYFRNHEKVYLEIETHNLMLILFPNKSGTYN